MALWDTADLLARCKNHARRPATDQAMTDAKWYSFLTEAEAEAYVDIYSRFPDAKYGPPQLLATADDGLTYHFGLDADGDPIRAVGHAEIYPNLSSIPDSPLTPGVDFMIEGGLLRMPGNRPRRFPNGPYARLVAQPDAAIDLTHEPTLQPKNARILLVDKALEKWARRPGSGAKPQEYAEQYTNHLNKVWMELATAFNSQGAAAAGAQGDRVWWYSSDLG